MFKEPLDHIIMFTNRPRTDFVERWADFSSAREVPCSMTEEHPSDMVKRLRHFHETSDAGVCAAATNNAATRTSPLVADSEKLRHSRRSR